MNEAHLVTLKCQPEGQTLTQYTSRGLLAGGHHLYALPLLQCLHLHAALPCSKYLYLSEGKLYASGLYVLVLCHSGDNF